MSAANRPTEKIIAYSVYGTSKLYLQGALECLDFNEKYLPDWKTEFYVARNCPALSAILKEESSDRCSVFIMPYSEHVSGSTVNVEQHHSQWHLSMQYRLRSLFSEENRIVALRDTDSRASKREADALTEWLESGFPVCAFYDNLAHANAHVMTGLTTWHTSIVKQIYKNYEDYKTAEYNFIKWYETEGYAQGLRFVHADLWILNRLFINRIGWDRLYKMGIKGLESLGLNSYLKGEMGEGTGEHLGATVHNEWRYLNYE